MFSTCVQKPSLTFLAAIAIFTLQPGIAQQSPAPAAPAADSQSTEAPSRGNTANRSLPARDGRANGMGKAMRDSGLPGGARGILGTVTDVTSEHLTVKTETGDLYTVHFSVNTRILRQPPGGRRFNFGDNPPDGTPPSSTSGKNKRRNNDDADLERQMPTTIKSTEIKVGDIITAGGEVDVAAKSLGAIMIMQIDAERAKQLREIQANYGKTWLAGRITAIDGTRITIEGMLDHSNHSIEVDENTSFRERRESVTLADVKPGQQLRAEGGMKDGSFRATVINAFQPRDDSGSPSQGNTLPVSPR